MQISSTKFIKGLVKGDETLNTKYSQIAFIGRSNVGKSSTINALTKTNDLARTSALPGRTQEVNVFLVNNKFYLVDLPGYGYAKMSRENRNKLQGLINWYLFMSSYQQEMIVLIIDAYIGPTKDDLEMLAALEGARKNIIIAANKVDKIKKSDYVKQFKKIQELIGGHKIIPYSSKTKDGLGQLIDELVG